MHKYDIATILSAIVGFSSLSADAAFSSQLSDLFGANGPHIVAVLGLLGALASVLIRVLTNPTVDTTPVVVNSSKGEAVVAASATEVTPVPPGNTNTTLLGE